MPRGSHRQSTGARTFPRTARINESMREVIAEELELLDDDRLVMVTVTGIDIDPDLSRAKVFYSALTTAGGAAEAFDEHRVRLQKAVGRQIRMKRTPLLSFVEDPAIAEGIKIERIIAVMPKPVDQPDLDEGLDADADVAAEPLGSE
jgi:ribosome-binding factor A